MTMSVIIPCYDDIRIAHCLTSIDDLDVEVVFSLNGRSPPVDRIVEDWARHYRRTTIVRLAEPNLADALECGSLAAREARLLFMDSDCRFAPGALALLKAVSERYEVVKGHVVFENDSMLSKVIARSREHHTAEVLTAYKPPLVVHRTIRERIGGYFFDRRLRWREDSDLDARIRKAGIQITGEPKAMIFHPPLRPYEDLRSAFRYGTGLARARWLGVELTEVPRSVLSTLRSKGVAPAAYMCVRNMVYQCGTWTEWLLLQSGMSSDV